MGKYFGTDGFRGEVGGGLTADHAFLIGKALGTMLFRRLKGEESGGAGASKERGVIRPTVVIGKDTRRSCYMLEYAVAAGLASVGADAYMLHVCTTPAVSYTVRSDGFCAGVMISASHNPFTDNGIKVIGERGEKLDDSQTEELEALMDSEECFKCSTGAGVGRIIDHFGGRNRYIGYLISMAKHSFGDLRIGLDCANGAAFMIAPAVFRALGATVVTIGDEPDGLNINRGFGSTNVGALCSLVKERGLDMGFAFDGDADRCIAVDGDGNEINGDKIAYILGVGMKKRGELFGDTVVTTVMSNAGLYHALGAIGIRSVQTAVGDRFIYEEMKRCGYSLGAEQSGHVIMSKYSVTGDGILTAIMLTEQVLSEKKSLGTLAAPVTMLPQWTENIAVKDKSIADRERVKKELDRISGELDGHGRILIRKSGTEPLIRIMAEARTEKECRLHALALRRVIEEEMGNEASAL